ncbi:hypothetical protein OROMI_005165 [Orobanche minor]
MVSRSWRRFHQFGHGNFGLPSPSSCMNIVIPFQWKWPTCSPTASGGFHQR